MVVAGGTNASGIACNRFRQPPKRLSRPTYLGRSVPPTIGDRRSAGVVKSLAFAAEQKPSQVENCSAYGRRLARIRAVDKPSHKVPGGVFRKPAQERIGSPFRSSKSPTNRPGLQATGRGPIEGPSRRPRCGSAKKRCRYQWASTQF
jgi:hypothetical protein